MAESMAHLPGNAECPGSGQPAAGGVYSDCPRCGRRLKFMGGRLPPHPGGDYLSLPDAAAMAAREKLQGFERPEEEWRAGWIRSKRQRG